jgi:hypothetical protein
MHGCSRGCIRSYDFPEVTSVLVKEQFDIFVKLSFEDFFSLLKWSIEYSVCQDFLD